MPKHTHDPTSVFRKNQNIRPSAGARQRTCSPGTDDVLAEEELKPILSA